jgi:outer membrane biosynthesis protein TonB
MRVGFAVSVIGHVAIFSFGFFAFFSTPPLDPIEITALPVELISVADDTDLLAGDEQSEILPEEEPQPVPEAQAEAPAPEPAEEPEETPVEAAREPTPPPPAPEPEPEVVPEEEEVAALPEPEPEPIPEAEPEPVAEPEETMPAEAPRPRPRPEPPEQVAEPEPTPDPIRELAEQEPAEEFNPDEVAALLNKQEEQGGGAPVPVEEPQTIGSIDAQPEAAMTQSELAALSARIGRCWSPPAGAMDAGGLIVEVLITFRPDGYLANEPVVMGGGSDPRFMAAADAAVRAVIGCQPYNDIFTPEKIALMSEGLILNFDPRQMMMLGG